VPVPWPFSALRARRARSAERCPAGILVLGPELARMQDKRAELAWRCAEMADRPVVQVSWAP
jgi:hypothetical protein